LCKQLAVVFGGQVRRKQSQSGQVNWPDREASITAGNRLAARATVIRLYAASSENRNSLTQHANMEGKACSRKSFRSSISPKCRRRSASVQ